MKSIWLTLAAVLGLLSNAVLAEPVAIRSQVLPVDSDSDGVVDAVDECYKTGPGVVVDARGCYRVSRTIRATRLNIQFDTDSVVVKPRYLPEVAKVADFMRQHPLSRAVIEGHTDSDGSHAYNTRLSYRRASAVVDALVSVYRIAPNRVLAAGFGEERPLVANDSPGNKFRNRRVVAVLRTAVETRGE